MTGTDRIELEKQDAECVRRALSGESQGFLRLVDAHRDRVYRMICAMIGDAHLAEDALQESLLEAHRSLANLREPQRFGAWLRGIAYRISADHLHAKRAQPLSLDPADAQEIAASATPEDDSTEAARTRRSMQSLPERYRSALALRYLGELSVAEIAETLGETVTNVKVILHRGREMLRVRLGGSL